VAFIKLYDEEIVKLVESGVSARVWSVYMSLRMFCYFPKAGRVWKPQHFMCFPSQEAILEKLNKPPPPKKKKGQFGNQTSSFVSTSVSKLIKIGMIKVYSSSDNGLEARSARKLMKSVYANNKRLKLGRVNVYRMVFWEACQKRHDLHVKSSMTGHVNNSMTVMSNPTCKEDELINIKKNNIINNILNEENINETSMMDSWIDEDEEMFGAGEDVREYVKQFESLSDLEISIEIGGASEEVLQALRVLKNRSILEQRVMDLISRS